MDRYIVITEWSSSRNEWCGQVVDTWHQSDNVVALYREPLFKKAEELATSKANELNTEVPAGVVA